MERVEGWVQLGNRTITVSGIVSSAATPVQRSYPSSTITVYLTGTLTLASIYSDNAGSAKANPFTADATGFYFFYVADGAYDVKLSGGTMPAPFTLGPDSVFDQNANWINVKASPYLAKGDGSTDDTTPITNAINAAASVNGRVFFPPGVYIISIGGSDFCLPQPSNVWIQGSGMTVTIIRVKANAGSYKSIFGPYGIVVNNFTCTDLTIDQNNINNVIPNQTDLNNHFRDVFSPTQAGGHFTLDHVQFTNLSGFNTVYCGCPYTIITNCIFDNIGGAENFSYDYSAIYSTADHVIMSNNIWVGRSLGANGAWACLETHGSSVTVTGNSCTNMFIGFHITSQEASEASAITVTGNTFQGVFNGMFLWSMQYPGHTTGIGLHGVVVANNAIRISQSAYFVANPSVNNAPSGIVVWPASNLPAKNIIITGNLIEFDLETISPPSPLNLAGFGVGYWDALQTNRIDEFTISNNRVLNAPGIAIRVDSDGSDINVANNYVLNPGSSPGSVNIFSRVGIFLREANSVAINNLLVTNNMIVDAQATSTMGYGMTIACPGNTAGGIVLDGNMISATGSNVTSLVATHAVTNGLIFINDKEFVPNSSGTLLPTGVQIEESMMVDALRGVRYRYKTGQGWVLFWNNVPLTGTAQGVNMHLTTTLNVDGALISPIVSIRNPGNTGSLQWYGPDSPTHLRWVFQPIDAEGGTNTGTNMYLFRYSDAGSFLGVQVGFERDNGYTTIYGDLDLISLGAVQRKLTIRGIASSAVITVGTGSPEGAVTAGPGSLYLNFGGGSGTTLYVKESGAGSTGWVGK